MFDKISLNLKSVLEPRLNISYFVNKNFYFEEMSFFEINSLNFARFEDKKIIVFLLNNDYDTLTNIDNLRKLLSCSLVFTNKNLFKLFGIPERYFIFNNFLDEKEFFISNNGSRTISEEIYFYNKIYSANLLNDMIKLTIPYIEVLPENITKIKSDIIKALCCGCSVFTHDHEILNLFEENIKIYLNLNLTEENKLDVQYELHKKYSTAIQIDNIEKQLYGIFGSKYDLAHES